MDNIYDAIIRYFSSEENDFAVMINGEWGCGKTYFIKNHIGTACIWRLKRDRCALTSGQLGGDWRTAKIEM